MNEVLAAGIIRLSGWDCASPFADGMCGSGTFVIEAALMARKIPPGAFRKQFGFERWKDYDPALYREVFQEATAEEKEKLPFEIVGSDLDAADRPHRGAERPQRRAGERRADRAPLLRGADAAARPGRAHPQPALRRADRGRSRSTRSTG